MITVVTVGTAVQDLVLVVDELPTGDGKTFASSSRVVGGGPAATAAAAIVGLGGRSRFVGRVGDDDPGRWIRSDLERWGVDVTLVATVPGARSAVSAVVVAIGGDRMIVNHTDPALFASPPPPLSEGASAILADLRWPQGAVAALREAREVAVPGILDFDLNTAGSLGTEAMQLATHVVFALPALEAFTGSVDPESGLRAAMEMTPATVAVTMGGEGVLWLDAGKVRSIPASRVAVVDTLGAGDVFHGAFALRIAEGAAIHEALRFASAAAGLKCSRPSGREGLPTRNEVNDLMEDTN